ncbi:MAG: hypothetical protein ACOVOQ_09260 [Flavobacterium sp.]|jgi:hypothetical protein
MNSTIKVKLAILISFLLIINPGKLSLPNGIILIIMLLQNLSDLLNGKLDIDFFLPTLTIMSLFLIFNKNKLLIFLGISIQWLWIIYMFKIGDLMYWYYVIPTLIYLTTTLLLIFKIFYRQSEIKL